MQLDCTLTLKNVAAHASAGARPGRTTALNQHSKHPPEMRTRSLGRPRAARTSAGMEAWLMKHGMLHGEVWLAEAAAAEHAYLKSCRGRPPAGGTEAGGGLSALSRAPRLLM